jgi:shikimate kinase
MFLVGFMGSGKSWLARRISEREGIPRYDLDEEIEKEQGMSITDIFRIHGEQGFRVTEREVLERLCQRILEGEGDSVSIADRPLAVVATGGGTPCFPDNMEWMNANGTTVWIDTPKDLLLERLKRGRDHRPLIRGLDDRALEAYVDSAMEMRSPHYAKAQVRWGSDGWEPLDLDKILEHA